VFLAGLSSKESVSHLVLNLVWEPLQVFAASAHPNQRPQLSTFRRHRYGACQTWHVIARRPPRCLERAGREAAVHTCLSPSNAPEHRLTDSRSHPGKSRPIARAYRRLLQPARIGGSKRSTRTPRCCHGLVPNGGERRAASRAERPACVLCRRGRQVTIGRDALRALARLARQVNRARAHTKVEDPTA
jgi:hypothetical protein